MAESGGERTDGFLAMIWESGHSPNGTVRLIADIAGRNRERRKCDGERTFMHLISALRNLLT